MTVQCAGFGTRDRLNQKQCSLGTRYLPLRNILHCPTRCDTPYFRMSTKYECLARSQLCGLFSAIEKKIRTSYIA